MVSFLAFVKSPAPNKGISADKGMMAFIASSGAGGPGAPGEAGAGAAP